MKNNKKLRTWLDDFNLSHPLVKLDHVVLKLKSKYYQLHMNSKIQMFQYSELVYGSQELDQECLKVLVLLD